MAIRYIFLFFVSLLIMGCGRPSGKAEERRTWMLENERVKVLCTTGQVAYLVREVGGKDVHVYTLIPPLSDPHEYQLVKGDDELFSSADLLFFSGLGLECGSGFQRYMRDPKTFLVGDRIVSLKPDRALYSGKVVDPHLWMDVSLWAEGASKVADALSAYMPEKTQAFHARAREVEKNLCRVHHEIERKLQEVPEHKRYLITTHDAFRYFVRAYMATEKEKSENTWEKRARSPEGLAPDSQMSTRELSSLVSYALEHHVFTLFPEFGTNCSSLVKLQEALKAKGHNAMIAQHFLLSDSLGPKGTSQENYEDMVYYDARIIERMLQHEPP